MIDTDKLKMIKLCKCGARLDWNEYCLNNNKECGVEE